MPQQERLIAFIDVLGFSELVVRQNFSTLFQKYIKIIRETIKEVSPEIEYVVFSDSIVILMPSDRKDDLLNLVKVMGGISFKYLVELEQGLPVKGCITSGKVTYDSKGKDAVIAGAPIVEAYKYEQQMDWIGMIISPNTIRKFPFLHEAMISYAMILNFKANAKELALPDNLKWNIPLYRYSGVPIKSNIPGYQETLEAICIVPHRLSSCDANHIVEDLKEYHKVLAQLLLYAPEPSIQEKYRNTTTFIQDVINNWDGISKRHEYRDAAWIMHQEKQGEIIVKQQLPPPRNGIALK